MLWGCARHPYMGCSPCRGLEASGAGYFASGLQPPAAGARQARHYYPGTTSDARGRSKRQNGTHVNCKTISLTYRAHHQTHGPVRSGSLTSSTDAANHCPSHHRCIIAAVAPAGKDVQATAGQLRHRGTEVKCCDINKIGVILGGSGNLQQCNIGACWPSW
jgi:hypothetical protein